MDRTFHLMILVPTCAVGLLALSACSDPSDIDTSAHLPPGVTGGAAGVSTTVVGTTSSSTTGA